MRWTRYWGGTGRRSDCRSCWRRISRRSTKGLDKEQDLEDPVIPFMVTIGLHTPDAHATYRALQLLSGNAVCKLKGAWPSNWRRITSPRRTVRGAAAHPAETAPCLGRPGGAAGSVGAQLRLSGGPDKPQLPAPRLVKCNFCYANSIAQALYWTGAMSSHPGERKPVCTCSLRLAE